MTSHQLSVRAGVSGIVSVVLGGVLIWFGTSSDHAAATVVGILLGVPGLIALRVRSWIGKERVLRRVGERLHVPDPSDREDAGGGSAAGDRGDD